MIAMGPQAARILAVSGGVLVGVFSNWVYDQLKSRGILPEKTSTQRIVVVISAFVPVIVVVALLQLQSASSDLAGDLTVADASERSSVQVGGDVQNSQIVQSEGNVDIQTNLVLPTPTPTPVPIPITCLAVSSDNSPCVPVFDGPGSFANEQIDCLSNRTPVEVINFSGQPLPSYQISSYLDSGDPIRIKEISPDGPASAAGLAFGDILSEVDGQPVESVEMLQAHTIERAGTEMIMTIIRDGLQFEVSVVPRRNPPAGQGPLGIRMDGTGVRKGDGGYVNAGNLYCNQDALAQLELRPTPTMMPSPVPEKIELGTICDSQGCNGDTATRDKDGSTMVYVPGGTFMMGSDQLGFSQPVHAVTLDGYWIDKTEVTNAQYAAFLNENGNQAVDILLSSQYSDFLWYDIGNHWDGVIPEVNEISGKFVPRPGSEQNAIFRITWSGALAYCRWVDAELPTEAQWEYAARGPFNFRYPWGNRYPDLNSNLGNFALILDFRPTAVGSFPAGASWVGALDLAGNVWEWVSDFAASYPANAQINPLGPASGDKKVIRGGDANRGSRIAAYVRLAPDRWDTGENQIGFRCASRVSPAHNTR